MENYTIKTKNRKKSKLTKSVDVKHTRRINAVYLRYSSKNQKATSNNDQLREITEYIEALNIGEIDKVYEDAAATGRNTKRTGYIKLEKDLKANKIKNVIVYSLDRLGRNTMDTMIFCTEADKRDTGIISVTEKLDNTASGRNHRRILISNAEFESDKISENSKRGQKSNVLKGEYNGGTVPYGYTVGKNNKFEILEEEAKIVRMIFNKCKEGLTLDEISKFLKANSVKYRNGNYISKDFVSRILRDVKYKGDYIFSKTSEIYLDGKVVVKKNSHDEIICKKNIIPKIIEVEEFDFIQEKLNKKSSNTNTAKAQYLLTGIVSCGECGNNYAGNSKGKNDFKKKYTCSGKKYHKNCKNKDMCRISLEDTVLDLVVDILTSTEYGKSMLNESISNILKVRRHERKLELQRLRREEQKLLKRGSTLISLFDDITSKQNEIKTNPIKSKEFHVESVMKVKERLKGYLLEEGNTQAKVAFIQDVIDKVVIHKDIVEITYYEKDKIVSVKYNRENLERVM